MGVKVQPKKLALHLSTGIALLPVKGKYAHCFVHKLWLCNTWEALPRTRELRGKPVYALQASKQPILCGGRTPPIQALSPHPWIPVPLIPKIFSPPHVDFCLPLLKIVRVQSMLLYLYLFYSISSIQMVPVFK